MDAEALIRGLTTSRMGRRVVCREAVGSTNDLAAEALRAGPVAEGTAFVAARQLRGRGTGGAAWLSAEAEGLWCSVVFRAPLRAEPLAFLPGVALVDVLREDHGIDASVKWPNDVLVEGRKISGTLIEVHALPGGESAWVMGIGVNVNQTGFAAAIADIAVSMRMATGRAHAREEVFRQLMARLERHYDSAEPLVDAWRARTRMLGGRIRARRRGRTFGATVIDVNDHGHLAVVLDDGRREEWIATVDLDIALE